ncbi:hypothetical protein TKK_0001698 [Trichogramma kaykai]
MVSTNQLMENIEALKAIGDLNNLGQEELHHWLELCNSSTTLIKSSLAGRKNLIRRLSMMSKWNINPAAIYNEHIDNNERIGDGIRGNANGEGDADGDVDADDGDGNDKPIDSMVNDDVANDANVDLEWRDTQRIFQSAIKMGEIVNHSQIDVRVFLNYCFPIFKIAAEETIVTNPIKCYCVIEIEFKSPCVGEEKTMIRWLHTKASVILEYTNLNEWYREFVIDYIDKRIDAFCENGSRWMVNRIVKLAVVMLNYEPFKGSSFIELPK